jgi:hypothetical protein
MKGFQGRYVSCHAYALARPPPHELDSVGEVLGVASLEAPSLPVA